MAEAWSHKDLSQINSPSLLLALDYWRSKVGMVPIPSRAALDPLEMRKFLAKILIVDIEGDDRFVIRLCGSDIVSMNGKDLTGRTVDAANLDGSASQFIDCYRRTIDSRAPTAFATSMWWQDRGYVNFEQLNLPLSTDGCRIDKLLCVIDFGRDSHR